MPSLWFDIAHLLAGGVLVLSLVLLYQDRITAVINVFALQAVTLALSVGWQAFIQGEPTLLVTALIALVVKGFVIPMALHRTGPAPLTAFFRSGSFGPRGWPGRHGLGRNPACEPVYSRAAEGVSSRSATSGGSQP